MAGFEATIHPTEGPRHAVALAHEQADLADVVVAVGGDGTVHEVAEGLVLHGGTVPMGVVPLGTGNDFAKMLGVPVGLAAVSALAQTSVAHADYGRVVWTGGEEAGSGYCFNGLGIGFDARVARAAARYKHLPGVAGYIAAVLETLVGWKAPHASIWLDGTQVFNAPLLLAAVGNGTTAGGGFVLTPQASIFDARLDACLIRGVPRRRILSLLPTALRGTHVHAPEVRMSTFTYLRLTSDVPVSIHADGEGLAAAAQAVEVSLVPAGLPVLTLKS